jgi:hypothetical protein
MKKENVVLFFTEIGSRRYNNGECNSNSERRKREREKTLSRYCKEEKVRVHTLL